MITPRYIYKSINLPRTQNYKYLEVFRVGPISLPYTNRRFIGPFLKLTLNRMNGLLGAYIWKKRSNTDFSLLHVHSDGFTLNLGYKLSEWCKRPIVVTVHQKLGYEKGDLRPNRRKYYRTFEIAKRIVVHRKSTQHLLQSWGFEQKTVFIPMFIDVEEYRRPDDLQLSDEDNVQILLMGGLEERKDPLTVLHAFSTIHRYHSNVELHIVGEGSLRRHIASLIRRYKLEKRVFLHGHRLDVRKYIWQSDIYISTNIVDNYPSLALREAMAAGLVPVVTDVGETRELIYHGVNGLLVPASDSTALSDAIVALIRDERLRKKLSSGAELSSKSFDIKRHIQHFIKIYREAMDE